MADRRRLDTRAGGLTARPEGPREHAGAACWASTAGYFVVEPIVASAWPGTYGFATNAISDLGVTTCGWVLPFGDAAPVCSPLHGLMNVTFAVTGLLTGAGALLLRRGWPHRRLVAVGTTLLLLTAVGSVLVGLAPADVNLPAHAAGALLQVPGAVAPVLFGLAYWDTNRGTAGLSLVCGVVGTVASGLFFASADLGLGLGTMERLAFWPLTLWTAGLGLRAVLRRPT